MWKVITVENQNGGGGKTSAVMNLRAEWGLLFIHILR